MAIAAVNTLWLGTPGVPAASGQIIASGGTDQVELAYKGVATFTLDGTATTAVINYIDGTQTIPFVPQAILATICGGTQGLLNFNVNTITNTGFSVTLSAAGTAANTVKVAFMAFR